MPTECSFPQNVLVDPSEKNIFSPFLTNCCCRDETSDSRVYSDIPGMESLEEAGVRTAALPGVMHLGRGLAAQLRGCARFIGEGR